MLAGCGGSSGAKTGGTVSGEFVIDSVDFCFQGSEQAAGRFDYDYDANGNTVYSATDADMDGIIDVESHMEYDSNGHVQNELWDGFYNNTPDGVVDLKVVYHWRAL